MTPPGGGVYFPSQGSPEEGKLTTEQRYALTRLGPDRFRRWVEAGRRSVSPR